MPPAAGLPHSEGGKPMEHLVFREKREIGGVP
jgi:hypothetical protein